MWTTPTRCPQSHEAEQNQKKRTYEVLPKPDNLIRYRQASGFIQAVVVEDPTKTVTGLCRRRRQDLSSGRSGSFPAISERLMKARLDLPIARWLRQPFEARLSLPPKQDRSVDPYPHPKYEFSRRDAKSHAAEASSLKRS